MYFPLKKTETGIIIEKVKPSSFKS